MDALLDLAAPYQAIFWLTAARLVPLAPTVFPRAAGLLPRFALVTGATLYFTVAQGPRAVPDAVFAPALAVNFLIGIVLSVGLQVVFGLWLSLGEAFDALRAANPSPVEVPGAQVEASPTAAMFALLGIVYFLSISGPAQVALALGHQLRHLPPEAPWAFFGHAGWLGGTLRLVAVLFSTVALVTLPLVFVLVFLELTVGFVGVWLPQTPAHFVMMPVRAFVALLFLLALVPLILDRIGTATLRLVQNIMLLS